MRTKLWILGAALSLLAATPASALKVYRAASEGLADVKVYVAGSKGQADCVIYVAPSEGVANGNARWYYESSAGQADVSMYFTDSTGLADKTVYFTNSEGLARCDVDWKSYKKERLGSANRAGEVGTQGSRIKGRVADIAGGAIAKVKITVRDSSSTYSADSDENGEYEISLPAGVYQISTDKMPGFAPTDRSGLRVDPGKVNELNITPTVCLDEAICILRVSAPAAKKEPGRQR